MEERSRALSSGRRTGFRLALLCAAFASAVLASPAVALPLISEVFYDAVGSDDGLGFVELYGVPGSSLDGLVIEGVNGSNGAVAPVITLSGVIPLDGFFVVADVTSAGTSGVTDADAFANFDFQNGPDSIVLRDAAGVLDAVGYGVFAPGEIFAGEGSPAADPDAGFSLARVWADVDTDDNAFDFVALDVPTPGSGPLLGVPEPDVALLFGAGLAAIAWLRRRGDTPIRFA